MFLLTRKKAVGWLLLVCLMTGLLPNITGAAESVLFTDDFETGYINGWAATSADFQVEKKNANQYLCVRDIRDEGRGLIGDPEWANYSYAFKLKVDSWDDITAQSQMMFYIRYASWQTYYALSFLPQSGEMRIVKSLDGKLSVLGAAKMEPWAAGAFQAVSIEANQNVVKVSWNGEAILTATDEDAEHAIGKGVAGLYYKDLRYCLDDVVITGFSEEKPLNIEGEIPRKLTEENGWFPISTKPEVIKDSILDMSCWNDTEIDKRGFLKIDDKGNYYFENEPGVPVKFYGNNLSVGYDFSIDNEKMKKEIDIIVDRYASFGYNIARFHANDVMEEWENGLYQKPTSLTIEPYQETIENFDYFVYALKQHGIYINVDVIAYAKFNDVPSLNGYGLGGANLAVLFPDGMTLWKQMAEQLLCHVNPYTGLALKDDPILVGVSPWNENYLYNVSYNEKLRNYLLPEINNYLTQKGRQPLEKLPGMYWQANAEQASGILDYVSHVTLNSYAEMKRYLKEDIGIKVPVGGFNYINDDTGNYWRSHADIHENHLYNGLISGMGASFTYVPNSHIRYSMTFDPESKKNYVVQGGQPFFRSYIPVVALFQNLNLPVAITEFTQEWPTAGREDVGMMVSAIGAFQDWDILNRFDFASKVRDLTTEVRMNNFQSFDSLTDMVVSATEYQASSIFRRGHVKPANTRFVMVLDEELATTTMAANTDDYKKFNMLYIPHMFKMESVFKKGFGEPYAVFKITPDMTAEQIAAGDFPAENRLDITPELSQKEAAEVFINALDDEELKAFMLENLNNNKLVSETGELVFDLNLNSFSVNTPYFAGTTGTLNKHVYTYDHAKIRADVKQGAISVAATDDKPLNESKRMQIVYVTNAAATGEQFIKAGQQDMKYVRGQLPNLVKRETAEVTVTTTLDPKSFKAYKVDFYGNRVETIPITVRNGNELALKLDTNKSFYFELVSSEQ